MLLDTTIDDNAQWKRVIEASVKILFSASSLENSTTRRRKEKKS